MAKVGNIRRHGALSERQHDAFLVALLVAVSITIFFFALQALLPRLAYLLQFLGPKQSVQLRQMEEEPEDYPFVLVDPSLLDEEDNPNQITEAESNLTRQARQTEERPELPDAFAYREDGIDEILTAPEGNPGPAVEYHNSEGDSGEVQPANEGAPDQAEQTPAEPEAEPAEPVAEQSQPETAATEPLEPVEAIEPVEPSAPEVEPPPETAPPPEATAPLEPLPDITEPAPAEPTEEFPEPPPEQPETVTPEFQELPESVQEPNETVPDPIDLAALPLSDEGWLDPETKRLEEIARQNRDYPPPPAQWREEPTQQPGQTLRPQPETVIPAPPREPTQRRAGRRPVEIKQVGNKAPASQRTASGGAPPRRNQSTSVKLIDADASMKLLAHRYGPYMEKLARQLQASLYTQAILSPTSYGTGQVKIRFGISPDGSLTYYDTLYPNDDSLPAERMLSEQMLREAAPFDPLTPEMQQDKNFQRMTVIVTLY